MDCTREPREMKRGFGLYNWGTLRDVFHYRKDALKYAKKSAAENGHPNWKNLYEIHPVSVKVLK